MTAQIIDLAAKRHAKHQAAEAAYLETLGYSLLDLAELMGIEIADDVRLGEVIVAIVTGLVGVVERIAA